MRACVENSDSSYYSGSTHTQEYWAGTYNGYECQEYTGAAMGDNALGVQKLAGRMIWKDPVELLT